MAKMPSRYLSSHHQSLSRTDTVHVSMLWLQLDGYFILNNDHCPRIHGCDGNQVLTEVYVWLSMWGISVHAGTAQFTAQMLSLSHLNAILSDDAAFIKSFASYTSTN